METLTRIDRVMINEHEATTRVRALKDYDHVAEVIFVRNDGWTLGAPKKLERAAYNQWPALWTHYTRWPCDKLKPIKEYEELNET